MNYLLDTHTFLWAISERRRLSKTAAEIFTSYKNELFLSVAGVWEILIKAQVGKLTLPSPHARFLKRQITNNRIRVLPMHLEHAMRIEQLPLHHRDPFDRILAAQSIEEKMPIVSADPIFNKYPVEVVW